MARHDQINTKGSKTCSKKNEGTTSWNIIDFNDIIEQESITTSPRQESDQETLARKIRFYPTKSNPEIKMPKAASVTTAM